MAKGAKSFKRWNVDKMAMYCIIARQNSIKEDSIFYHSSYRAYRRRLPVDFAAIEKFGNLGRLWLQVSPGAQRGRSRNVAWIRYVAGGQLSAEREIRPVEPRWPLKLNIFIVISQVFKSLNFIHKFHKQVNWRIFNLRYILKLLSSKNLQFFTLLLSKNL